MRPLIVGNWKMNGLLRDEREIERLVVGMPDNASADVVVCPPATLIARFAGRLSQRAIAVGGQDCHPEPSGAHTGDISAAMLVDAGAQFVIVGHSERRQNHGESDALVRRKCEAATTVGLTPIICVGETADERRSGRAEACVRAQLDGSLPNGGAYCVIAYEPVWAIGTGKTPTLAEIAMMHASIRRQVPSGTRILYGGSVNPANAAEILCEANVDGALVGGASLRADDFLPIIAAASHNRVSG